MLKSFINKALKAALSELFLNANEGVTLSLGSDLFTDSNLNLKNLIIRPDLFDVLLQPLHLVSGQISSLKLEGIAEMAFGGKLRLTIDNVYLLFQVDEDIDAERSQILKKILIELTSSNSSLPQLLLREILKKIQGYPSSNNKSSGGSSKDAGGVGGDVKKKRRLLIKALNYAFTNISVLIRTVHIRFEVPTKPVLLSTTMKKPSSTSSSSCAAFGWTIPQVKIIPYNPASQTSPKPTNRASTHMDMGGSIPQLSLHLKGLQMYCDPISSSYTSSSSSSSSSSIHDIILQEFKHKWSSESHTSMLLPVDLEIAIAVEVRKRTGLTSFKVATNISSLRMSCDIKQLEIICDFFDRYIAARKRSYNQLRLRGIFGKKYPPPFISELGGVTILPHLLLNQQQYPQLGSIPRASYPTTSSSSSTSSSSIISLLKSRLGPNWGKALWRYVYRMIVEDIRRHHPYHRWIELIKLCWIRKQYVFLYARLLRRSKDTGNFMMNLSTKIDISYGMKIFEYEMMLPVDTIKMFRCLSMMICFVELMNSKRKQAIKASSNGGMMSWEKIQLPWHVLTYIHSCIIECQRRSVFQKSERLSPDDDTMTDNMTDLNTDDDSHYDDRDYKTSASSSYNNMNTINKPSSASSASSSSMKPSSSSSSSSSSMYGTAKAVVSMQSSAMKMLGHALASTTSSVAASISGSSSSSYDDDNNKFLSRGDLLAFADWFALFESESTSSSSSSSVYDVPATNNKPSSSSSPSTTSTPVSSSSIQANNNNKSSSTNAGQKPRPLNLPSSSSQPSSSSNSLSELPSSSSPMIPSSSSSSNDILSLKDIKYEVFDWQLAGSSPSSERIIDSIQLIMNKDQNILTIIPPDISFRLGLIECNIRYPIIHHHHHHDHHQTSSRKILSSMIFRDVMMNIIITYATSSSSSSSSPKSSSKIISSSSLSSKNKKLDETQLRNLQAIVPIMGSLIQLRLTVTGFEWHLHVHNDHLLKIMNGTSSSSSSSSVKDKIRNKKLIRSFGIISDHHDEADDDNHDNDNDDDDNQPSAASDDDNHDDDDDQHHDDEERNNQWDDLLHKYQPPVSNKSSSYMNDDNTTDTSSTINTNNASSSSSSSDAIQVVKLFHSKPDDRFLVICILLDFDYKGEGAADVQLHLGECNIDASGASMACILDDDNIIIYHRIISLYHNISSMMKETSLLYHLRDEMMMNIMMKMMKDDDKHDDKHDDMMLIGRVVSHDDTLKLLNVKHYHSILDYLLPKVVTVSMRSSRINADYLSASLIRNLIYATFQQIAANASSSYDRINKPSSSSSSSMMSSSLSWLQDVRMKIIRSSSDDNPKHTIFCHDRAKMVINAMEMNINKTSSSPSSSSSAAASSGALLEMKGLGMEMVIPIDDDTLCLALALFFASYFPVYT